MKNGRFSEKKSGKRWLTCDLEGVALDLAEVGVDCAFERRLGREAVLHGQAGVGLESAGENAVGVARVSRREYVAVGVTSRVSGRLRSWSTSAACCSMKLFPAGTTATTRTCPGGSRAARTGRPCARRARS